MRVLIVDDSRAMRMIVKRGLRQAGLKGVQMDEAANGIEAIAQMRKALPDIVISDWNMPEMDGLALLKAVRKAGYKGKFGFVTSATGPELSAKATACGAQFVVGKPFTPERLAAALKGRTDGRTDKNVAAVTRDLSAANISNLLGRLLNKELRVSSTPPMRFRPGEKLATATFVDGDGKVVAVALAEPDIALGAAAALSMMPVAAVEQAKCSLQGAIADNLREIFNIFARVLSSTRATVKLEDVDVGKVGPDAVQLIASSKFRSDLLVRIPGYGEGKLSLFGSEA